MDIIIKKDGEGFLAEVKNMENLFAYGDSKEKAVSELYNVIEMMMDYHLEQVEIERTIKNQLLKDKMNYAV